MRMMMMPRGNNRSAQNTPNRKQKVKLLITNLQEILRIELDRRVAREVENTLDGAAVLSENFEGKTTPLEVVEDPCVVAADVHSATKGGEIDVNRGFLRVSAENNGVGLHVVLKVFTLKLRESCFYVTPRASFHSF